jgi:hypothetical protein
MSAILESLAVMVRPGTTGNAGSVGTTVFTASNNGAVVSAPYHFLQDSNIIHDKVILNSELLAASVDKHIWACTEGRWQVSGVTEIHSVAGGSGAQVDVKVTSGVTAPASGTTQLGSVVDLTVTANTVQQKALIASPTVIGPGDTVALDFGGTLTALVGIISVSVKRVG